MAVGMVGMFGVEGPLTHIFRLLLIAYSDAAMHSTAQQCTVCLLMHSLLTYAQHAYLRAAFLNTSGKLSPFPSNETSCLFQHLPLTSMGGTNGRSSCRIISCE